MKISREGIVLIKSFEGFRPRAILRQDGGWIIGYGHTLSAHEGASVSEADAELLLRYDLLPIEKSLNETVETALNQHQFDALASFAFSVGLDRFASSDVRQRLTAGAPAEAADAMMGWPEPLVSDTALRRRVAERALFSADPAQPVALADLLAAPLPPPPRVPEAPVAEPEVEVEAAPDADTEDQAADPRGAAVATLLGETEPAPEAEAVVETSAVPAPTDAPAEIAPVETPTGDEADVPAAPEPVEQLASVIEPGPASDEIREAAEPLDADNEADTDTAPAEPSPNALALARYAPYGARMTGPLPYLRPVNASRDEPEPELPSAGAPTAAAEAPADPAPEPSTEAAVAVVDAQPQEPAAAAVEADFDEVVAERVTPMSYREPAFASDQAPVLHIPGAPLVLTPMDDAPEPAMARALWTPEQRSEPASADAGLFGEDLSLTHSVGPVLGQEFEVEPPVRFDWSETGAFIIMGAVGLTAFGASMAAFRLASEQSNGGNETTMIAWVLAVIGATCVGVSSFNLYRRWGLPGGD